MSKIFMTSDQHFYHFNIIKYCSRPFDTWQEMNETIIRNHNERIKKDDTVYILGDFGFFASSNRAFRGEGEPFDIKKLLDSLNGNKIFIAGNHEKRSNKLDIKTTELIIRISNLNIQMIHDPADASIEYDLILCGHVHNNWKLKEIFYRRKHRLLINVGVDVWNFRPVEWQELYGIYCRWKKQRESLNKWEYPPILNELNKPFIIPKA